MVDHLALIVGNVVVFEEILANIEVMRFDLALSALDLTCQQLRLDRFTLSHARSR